MPSCRALAIFLLFSGALTLQAEGMKLGVEVLQEEGFAPLKGKKIGLVVNPASVDSRLNRTADLFLQSKHCKTVALFGPEHGVYGDEYAGIEVSDRHDSRVGIPIYSLYGKHRKPSSEMLKGLDALVFDLQDIGSRSYTYISTMRKCLEACAENDVTFVVLDRPNPLGGARIEGPMVKKGFESFISDLPVPYVHGMTTAELALLVRETFAPNYQKLVTLKMKGWKRSTTWEQTGLKWISTSPHIPQASSCAAYAATGILGELQQISNGVGYPLPFEMIGAPFIQAEALAETFRTQWGSLEKLMETYDKLSESPKNALSLESAPVGVQFYPIHFKPFYGLFKDQACEGVGMVLDPQRAENLVEINFCILATLDAPQRFKEAAPQAIAMFDKAIGTDEARKCLMEKGDLKKLFSRWRSACEDFRKSRKKYLLYD
jgi:uncharacterized protein YbbC (DUF1343 family)